jgi:hypothetical protein
MVLGCMSLPAFAAVEDTPNNSSGEEAKDSFLGDNKFRVQGQIDLLGLDATVADDFTATAKILDGYSGLYAKGNGAITIGLSAQSLLNGSENGKVTSLPVGNVPLDSVRPNPKTADEDVFTALHATVRSLVGMLDEDNLTFEYGTSSATYTFSVADEGDAVVLTADPTDGNFNAVWSALFNSENVAKSTLDEPAYELAIAGGSMFQLGNQKRTFLADVTAPLKDYTDEFDMQGFLSAFYGNIGEIKTAYYDTDSFVFLLKAGTAFRFGGSALTLRKDVKLTISGLNVKKGMVSRLAANTSATTLNLISEWSDLIPTGGKTITVAIEADESIEDTEPNISNYQAYIVKVDEDGTESVDFEAENRRGDLIDLLTKGNLSNTDIIRLNADYNGSISDGSISVSKAIGGYGANQSGVTTYTIDLNGQTLKTGTSYVVSPAAGINVTIINSSANQAKIIGKEGSTGTSCVALRTGTTGTITIGTDAEKNNHGIGGGIEVSGGEYVAYTTTKSNAKPKITIYGGTYDGKVYNNKGEITVYGGEFKAPLDDSVTLATGYSKVQVAGKDDWVTVVKNEKHYVADVDGQGYETLAEAIEAATSGKAIVLRESIDLDNNYDLGSAWIEINKALTLDGKGFAITTSSAEQAVKVTGNGAVEIKDLTVNATAGNGIAAQNYNSDLTVTGSTLTVAKRGIDFASPNTNNTSLTVSGSTIQTNVDDPKESYTTGEDARGINLVNPDTGSKNLNVTLTDTTIQGFSYCINVPGTIINVKVTMTGGATYGRAAVNNWGKTSKFTLTNVHVNGLNNQTGATEGFACFVDNESSAQSGEYVLNNVTVNAKLSDAAANTEGSTATEYLFSLRGSNAAVKLSGNTTYTVNTPSRGGFADLMNYGSILLDETAKDNLAEYIEDMSGYFVVANQNNVTYPYKVDKAVAQIGTTKYETLGEAIAALTTVDAKNGATLPDAQTITLLTDVSGGYDFGSSDGTKAVNAILDLDGHTLTFYPGIGSSGTETNGIRVLAYSQLEVKNGTLHASNQSYLNSKGQTKWIKVGIANYGTLTLDSVSVTQEENDSRLLCSINNGGLLYLKGNTNLVTGANSVSDDNPSWIRSAINNKPYGAVYNVKRDASVNVTAETGTNVVVGKIVMNADGDSYGSTANLNIAAGTFGEVETTGTKGMTVGNITGGTFSSDPDEAFVADGYVSTLSQKDGVNWYTVTAEEHKEAAKTTTETDETGATTSATTPVETKDANGNTTGSVNVVAALDDDNGYKITVGSGNDAKTSTGLISVESQKVDPIQTTLTDVPSEITTAASKADNRIGEDKVDTVQALSIIAAAAEVAGADATQITDVKLQLRTQLTGYDVQTTQEGTVTSVTFDVTPYAVTTIGVTGGSQVGDVSTGGTTTVVTELPNSALVFGDEGVPVSLPVPTTFTAEDVIVTCGNEFITRAKVTSVNGVKSVNFNARHFSEYTYSADETANADNIISFAGVDLNGTIDFNFKFSSLSSDVLYGGYATLQLEHVNDEFVEKDPIKVSSFVKTDGYYVLTYPLPVKEMGYSVTVTLFDSEDTVQTIWNSNKSQSYSAYTATVTAYLDQLKASYEYSSTLYSSGFGSLRKELIDYSEVARIYFLNRDYGFATNAILPKYDGVGYAIGEKTADASTLYSYMSQSNLLPSATATTVGNLSFNQVSVIFESDTTLRLYFKLASGSINDYSVTVGGESASFGKSGSYYYVDITGIKAEDLAKLYTVRVAHGGDSMTINYSALGYARSVLASGKTSDTMKQLVRAMYSYYLATVEYIANN